MSALFTPMTLRSVTARNRLWVAPMCQYSVELEDGVPTTWHATHLGSFAVGGAGLVMTEATAVTPDGRISPQDTGIWNDAQRDAWAPIAAFIRAQGAIAAIQLAPAGRRAWTRSGERRRLAAGCAVGRRLRGLRYAPRAGCLRAPRHRRRLRQRGATGHRRRIRAPRSACGARVPAAPVPLAAVEPSR